MVPLPVIVSFGGINPAGRSSFHHAYRRMVADSLDASVARQSYQDLAMLMGLIQHKMDHFQDADGHKIELEPWLSKQRDYIDSHTLIRKLENNLFDPAAILKHVSAQAYPHGADELSFRIRTRELPEQIPGNWQVEEVEDSYSVVKVAGVAQLLLPDFYASGVNCAGQLPSGFTPQHLYPSRNHPRGLQLSVFGASDAIQSMGLSWDKVMAKLAPDQIGVYASSAMGQMDYHGNGGLLQARLQGKRVTSKQLPLAFSEMPGDFVNAYIAGSLGGSGGVVGACATFLYNLAKGVDDIRSGSKRVVVVGAAEAPITAEIIDGYRTMGALADDASLLALDAGRQEVDYRRACRPFSDNCGFTLSESSQFAVLFDDELALDLGANIYGAVADVFVNADGYKKSISSPGVGNYISMAKAVAATRAIVGEEGIKRSYVQAHGTGTPQNRVTESHILSQTAKAFGIRDWPVAAIKSYVGHSIGAAAGDQLAASLGVWRYGVLPGIRSIDHLADDVHKEGLDFLMQNKEVGAEAMEAVILNSKGFGGNNASAGILSPMSVKRLLMRKHGKAKLTQHQRSNEPVSEQSLQYDEKFRNGQIRPLYQFGYGVKTEEDIQLTRDQLKVAGYEKAINLKLGNPYL